MELDNAFGLVEGGDVRVAGANAGQVVKLRLDERTQKALVDVRITEKGFGSLRSDVFCEARPQSPIGEYFLDCLPGTAKRELPPGSRVPVKQTASTIPPDLIQNIMRLPYRERFRLIVNEFGAGVAGRPEDLNEAIRRGVPALRQTSRLLEVLAEHDTVIRDLVTDADTVLKRLSDNRKDVGRFVVEARDTSSASAERRDDIQTNFRKLPDFLEELTPTMAALGEVATEQRPVLVDLNASARELEALLRRHRRAVDGQPARDPRARGRRGARAARPCAPHARRSASCSASRAARPTSGATCGSCSRTSTIPTAPSSPTRAAQAAGASPARRRCFATYSASRSPSTPSTSWATWCAPPCTPTSARPTRTPSGARIPTWPSAAPGSGPTSPA